MARCLGFPSVVSTIRAEHEMYDSFELRYEIMNQSDINNLLQFNMKRFFFLGVTLMVSAAMLMTACKKDEVNNSGNNINIENPGGGGDEGGGGTAVGYVDLELPSGTKWKSVNETGGYNGFYTFDEAVSTFGDKLPTKEQLEELIENCTWEWQNNGYKVSASNGNSIFLPAAGQGGCSNISDVSALDEVGYYWSSTPYNDEAAWYLCFFLDEIFMDSEDSCNGQSVRLVQKQILGRPGTLSARTVLLCSL